MEELSRKLGAGCEGGFMTITERQSQVIKSDRMPLLKKLFWTYFLLLIFEGALRKWILPQLAGPLLVVRDPIALLIIVEAYRDRKWPRQWAGTVGILTAGLFALCFLQLVVGETRWFIALYGLRSYLLPFPVAFIMGANLDEEDLRKFGTCILWLLLPLTALEVAQYLAAPSSFLNVGASIGAVQLESASGHVRASATFSYVVGPVSYIPLAAAFIFYGLANARFAKKSLLWAAAFALVLAVPVTGSRSLVFLIAGVVACVGLAAFFGVSQFVKSLQMITALLLVSALVSRLPIFSQATDTLVTRFTLAAGSEGNTEDSLMLRLVRPVTGTIEESIAKENWLGTGVGYGASAISKLLTGTQIFLAGEDEFARVLNEFGAPAGMAFMFFRWTLALMIAAKALSRVREHQPLAWLLVPLMSMTLIFGVLEQPTEQGFMVISVAFSLAALRLTEIPVEEAQESKLQWKQRRFGMGAQ
jgi:hypothetical protein